MDNSSLAHSKWNGKYYIVFTPKCRRQIIYEKIKRDIGQILRKLCEHKGVEIIEANSCKDHTYVSKHTIEIKCSWIYGILKGEKRSYDL